MVEKVKYKDEIYDKSIEKSQLKDHVKIKKQKSGRNCEKFEEIKSLIHEKITRRAHKASIEVGASKLADHIAHQKV